MPSFSSVATLAVVSLFLGTDHVRAAERGELIRPEGTARIADLQFKSNQVEIVEKEIEGQKTLWAQIKGTFLKKSPNHSLLHQFEPIPYLPDSGSFSFEVKLIGQSSTFSLIAIDPIGAQVEEKIALEYPGWNDWVTTQKKSPGENSGPLDKKQRFTLGISPTLISYRETSTADFSEIALTFKAGYTYHFSPLWEASMGGYGTLLAVAQSQSDITARFLGLNFRVGYNLPALQSPEWKVTLNGGVYYTTMAVTRDVFGFVDLAGPQFIPTVVRKFPNGNSWSTYVKFAPVSDALKGLSISNREVALGGGYHWTRLGNPEQPSSARTISAVMDLSNLKLSFPGPITVNSTSVSLGMAYEF